MPPDLRALAEEAPKWQDASEVIDPDSEIVSKLSQIHREASLMPRGATWNFQREEVESLMRSVYLEVAKAHRRGILAALSREERAVGLLDEAASHLEHEIACYWHGREVAVTRNADAPPMPKCSCVVARVEAFLAKYDAHPAGQRPATEERT